MGVGDGGDEGKGPRRGGESNGVALPVGGGRGGGGFGTVWRCGRRRELAAAWRAVALAIRRTDRKCPVVRARVVAWFR
jgi:hypothetical protein